MGRVEAKNFTKTETGSNRLSNCLPIAKMQINKSSKGAIKMLQLLLGMAYMSTNLYSMEKGEETHSTHQYASTIQKTAKTRVCVYIFILT